MLSVHQFGRKRQRTESPDHVHDVLGKKQRRSEQPVHWKPSEQFWDTLPKIYLTNLALTEHNRRNRLQTAPPFRRRAARLRSARTNQIPTQLSGHPTRSSAELKRFARRGGPDLTSVRGFPDPTMSEQTSRPSRPTTSTRRTTTSKRSTPYDANYEYVLAQAGIHITTQKDEQGHKIKPTNFEDIAARLSKARPSLSPTRFTEQDFQDFQEQTEHENLESETMLRLITVIEGGRDRFNTRMGSQFNNLEPLHQELAMAVPDSYDGAPPMSIDYRVLHDLHAHIVPNTDSTRPAAPNFFLEAKSKKGRADVAKLQAAHDGATGARAMMSLQSYQSPTQTYDGNAYSFTNTYHDGALRMYTSHATAPTTLGGPPQYHMTQLRAFSMDDSSRSFREGATHYRNARDMAKEQRDLFIQQANQAVRFAPFSKHSARSRTSTNNLSTRTTSQSEICDDVSDTDTSTDELALDKAFKRTRRTLADSGVDDEVAQEEEEEEEEEEGDTIHFKRP